MSIKELIVIAKSKHINDPIMIARWIKQTQSDWKAFSSNEIKVLVRVNL